MAKNATHSMCLTGEFGSGNGYRPTLASNVVTTVSYHAARQRGALAVTRMIPIAKDATDVACRRRAVVGLAR